MDGDTKSFGTNEEALLEVEPHHTGILLAHVPAAHTVLVLPAELHVVEAVPQLSKYSMHGLDEQTVGAVKDPVPPKITMHFLGFITPGIVGTSLKLPIITFEFSQPLIGMRAWKECFSPADPNPFSFVNELVVEVWFPITK